MHSRLTKPFWYDEAWRAYRIDAPGGFWRHLGNSDGPYALGFAAVLHTATALFGPSEWVLRLPLWVGLAALPAATFALIRPVAGRLAGLAGGFGVLLNISVLDFGTQLKPFAIDGLAAVVIVLLWTRFRAAGGWSGVLSYAAIGVCCLVAIPAVFVAAPLLAAGAVTAVRSRRLTRVIAPVAAGGIAVAHLLLFVAPQTALQADPFWTREYASDRGWMPVLLQGLRSVLPGLVTGTGRSDSTLTLYLFHPVSQPWRIVLVLALLLLLIRGTAIAAGNPAGRALLLAVFGAAAGCFLASAEGRWPFALERVNLFLVPLLLALAAIGLKLPDSHPIVSARSSIQRRPRTAQVMPLALVLLLWSCWMVVLGTGVEKTRLMLRIGTGSTGELLEQMDKAVTQARLWAGPRTLAVVHPQFSQSSWSWYMNQAQHLHHTGISIPADRSLFDARMPGFTGPGQFRNRDGDLDGLLRSHPGADQILLLVLPRRHQPTISDRLQQMRLHGWCPKQRRIFEHTGFLIDLRRC